MTWKIDEVKRERKPLRKVMTILPGQYNSYTWISETLRGATGPTFLSLLLNLNKPITPSHCTLWANGCTTIGDSDVAKEDKFVERKAIYISISVWLVLPSLPWSFWLEHSELMVWSLEDLIMFGLLFNRLLLLLYLKLLLILRNWSFSEFVVHSTNVDN